MATKVPPTEDLPGIPPVPPSDMSPKVVAYARKRLASLDKSIAALKDEQASISGIPAFADRWSYCVARIEILNSQRIDFVKLIEGSK